jgi:hypothetical protein
MGPNYILPVVLTKKYLPKIGLTDSYFARCRERLARLSVAFFVFFIIGPESQVYSIQLSKNNTNEIH